MTVQTTLPDIVSFVDGARRTSPVTGALRGSLARCGDWLRCRIDAARLREMEPRMARDIGVAPSCDARGPEGFAMDPRPFWGIGLTPQPMDVVPPWSGNRRSG